MPAAPHQPWAELNNNKQLHHPLVKSRHPVRPLSSNTRRTGPLTVTMSTTRNVSALPVYQLAPNADSQSKPGKSRRPRSRVRNQRPERRALIAGVYVADDVSS